MATTGASNSRATQARRRSSRKNEKSRNSSTIISRPRILLIDEPFGALCPRIRLGMQDLLVQLRKEQEGTVFFVTHSVEEAVYLGDRVHQMAAKPGRLVEVLKVPQPQRAAGGIAQENLVY